VELLAQLPIEVDDSVADIADIADIAVAVGRRHASNSYDASYLVLAERLGASLATRDTRLASAAGGAGVELLVEP
jgi:predicted nucleic acid-binding protein